MKKWHSWGSCHTANFNRSKEEINKIHTSQHARESKREHERERESERLSEYVSKRERERKHARSEHSSRCIYFVDVLVRADECITTARKTRSKSSHAHTLTSTHYKHNINILSGQFEKLRKYDTYKHTHVLLLSRYIHTNPRKVASVSARANEKQKRINLKK